jgi:hypothetical protein
MTKASIVDAKLLFKSFGLKFYFTEGSIDADDKLKLLKYHSMLRNFKSFNLKNVELNERTGEIVIEKFFF